MRSFEVDTRTLYDMRIKPQLHFKVHSDEFPPFLITEPRARDYTLEWTLYVTGVKSNVLHSRRSKYSLICGHFCAT